MSGLWEELLGPATLGGVSLPVTRRRISGGRDVARKRFPYVGGQEVEDTGRQPRSISIEVALFNDMDEADLYPARYEELVGVLQDDTDQAEVLWEDPVWGPIDVKVLSWDAEESADERDGVRMTLEMEEVGTEESAQAFSLLTTSDRSTAETEAAEFDALIEELAVEDGDIEGAWEGSGFKKKPGESTSFLDGVRTFTRTLDAGLRRADDVQREVDTMQARISSVMNLTQVVDGLESWAMIDRGSRLLASVASIGDSAISSAVRIVEITTTTRTSVFDLALQLYDDPSRVDEIIEGNPLGSPLYMPVGTVLRVLET